MAKSNDYICLSLSDEILKIVHVKGQGPSAKVASISARDVKGISDVEMIRVIETSLKGLPVKSANILSIAPSGITTTKNIEIPSTNDTEIQSIVNLQASRHTPFSREEIQIGYVNIGVHKSNYTKVLLAIANRVQLKDQVKLFEKSGSKVNKVLFAPESISELYGRSRQLKKSSGPIGIIDIDKRSTNFIITMNGKALTSRSIPVGRDDLSFDATGSQIKLVDELKKTVESYLSEDIDQAPSIYYFTSDDSYSKDIQSAITTNLGWDTQIAEYADQLKVPKSILKQLADASDISFLDVLAGAAMAGESKINLIPEEVQLQKSIEEQRNQVYQTAILCVIALVLVACVFYLKLHFKNAYLTNMVEKYEDTKSQVAILKREDNKTTLIKQYLDSRMVSLDTIHELYKHVPNNVYLTRVVMDEQGVISVQGVAESGSIVHDLNKTLNNTGIFYDADVKSNKPKKDRGRDSNAFEITLNLNESKDSDKAELK